MANISAHDHFIRTVFSHTDAARDFFQQHIPPALKQQLDLSTLTPEKESFISDDLRLKVADVLFSLNKHGQKVYAYCLLEHQSNPDKLMPFRLLTYITRIMQMHLKRYKTKRLPLVIPFILYTGKKPYTYSTDLFDLFGENKAMAKELFLSPYELIDLSKASEEDLEKYEQFRVAAMVSKHIHDHDLLPYIPKLIEALQLLERDSEHSYIYATLSYIVEKGEVSDAQQFFQAIAQSLETIDEERVMTIAEQLRQQGRQEGMQQVVRKMLQRQCSLEEIMAVTDWSLDQIVTVQRTLH